ncbi:MAG: hypothetical protein WBA23_00960 [Tunicatimonas sp.]|uniref:hypothetical protein n=1 Tax=Tunicatimonas sp. TaxID=1940096 RepID=UPI003C758FD5
MKYKPANNRHRLSFFSHEPKFSTWIILGSLVLLTVVLLYMSCDYQTPVSELFCNHADKKVKVSKIINFKEVLSLITNELGLMPK